LLELILRRPGWLSRIGEAILPESLRSAECRLIYSTCLRLAAAGGTPDFDTLMLELEDADLRHLLVQLEERCRAKADSDAELQLEQTLGSYRRRKEDAQHRRRIAALQDEPSEAGQMETLDQLLTALRPRHRTSDPTDG
jgi:hypothetical protein